jgi:large subunit ribosomal protein L29
MDIDKVRALSDSELDDALREAKQDLWQARFALSTRQLKDYSSIPETRRTIARILTVQRERATGQAAGGGSGPRAERAAGEPARAGRGADR